MEKYYFIINETTGGIEGYSKHVSVAKNTFKRKVAQKPKAKFSIRTADFSEPLDVNKLK